MLLVVATIICYIHGMKLVKYLEKHNITQSNFAKRLGISHQTVNYWISGSREPSLANIRAVYNKTAGEVTANDWIL